MNEQELIASAKSGAESAFEELVVANWPKLQALFHKHYRLQQSDLDDVLQNATNKAWTKIGSFRGESAFLTWFYTIVRNEAINSIKKRHTIDSHEVSASVHLDGEVSNDGDYDYLPQAIDQKLSETAEFILERQETLKTYRQIIEETLSKLTPVHSNILRLSLEEGLSYKEIAAQLDIPIGTVMSRLFFARKHAQKLIKQFATEQEVALSCLSK